MIPADRSSPDAQRIVLRLADQLPSLLGYWDRDLRCGFANAAYARWFGADPARMPGTRIQDLLGPALFEKNRPFIDGALRGEKQVFERSITGPDGVLRHSIALYEPDIVDGEVRGFFVEVTEITALKEAERALRESEQRFRALSESSPLGIFYANAEGRGLYMNPRWQEIFGMSVEEGIGEGWARALHPDDAQRVRESWRAAVARATDFEEEFRVVHAGGRERTVHVRGGPVRGDGDEFVGLVGVVEDITERRAAEERLRASEQFLDRTGRIARVGGWEYDLRTQQVTWSRHLRLLYEVDDDFEPHIGGSQPFYSPADWDALWSAATRTLADGVPYDLELPLVTAKGRPLWIRIFGEVECQDGHPVRMIGACQDVTEQRRRKDELEREQARHLETQRHAEELDRLLRERSEMLDVLAHEVRQPLNNASAALQGASSALGELGDGPAVERLKRAQAVISRVMAGIDNTLAVASLLARPGRVRRADADVDTLLDVAIADMAATARARIRVARRTDTRTVSMDTNLMRLALRNLLSNALRCSPPSSEVTITISDWDDPLALVIDVGDSGPGLSPEALAHLFERHRALPAEIAGLQGMGLGLYIVRRVMELHGGRVELVHTGPAGSTFRLVLEQAPEEDD